MDDLYCALKDSLTVESLEPPSVDLLMQRINNRHLRRRLLATKVAIGFACLGLIVITAVYIAQPRSVSVRAAGAPASEATITGQILLAGPAQLRALPGTVWAFERNLRGEVVASAASDRDGAFSLEVPAPGVYVIGGDSSQFIGGSPIPTHPAPACVSSTISVSPQTTATVQVLCQAQ